MRKPLQYIAGVSVRGKDGIEHLFHCAITNNEGETLEKLHSFHSEGRQANRTREFESLIGKQRKGEVQTISGLALISRILSGKSKYGGDAQSFEFCVMVSEGATLWRASPGAGNIIPSGGIRLVRNPGSGKRIDDHLTG